MNILFVSLVSLTNSPIFLCSLIVFKKTCEKIVKRSPYIVFKEHLETVRLALGRLDGTSRPHPAPRPVSCVPP